MIIQCREKDREMLVDFLEEDAEYNAPVIRELESCSFDEKQHLVYAEVEKEECVGVYLCSCGSRNLMISCREHCVNVDFLEQFFGMYLPDTVTGKPDDVRVAGWLLTDYEMPVSDGRAVLSAGKAERGCGQRFHMQTGKRKRLRIHKKRVNSVTGNTKYGILLENKSTNGGCLQ